MPTIAIITMNEIAPITASDIMLDAVESDVRKSTSYPVDAKTAAQAVGLTSLSDALSRATFVVV